jgi:hypothetical protein
MYLACSKETVLLIEKRAAATLGNLVDGKEYLFSVQDLQNSNWQNSKIRVAGFRYGPFWGHFWTRLQGV